MIEIGCVLHFVQKKVLGYAVIPGYIQHHKKQAEEWEDKVKKNQEAFSNIKKKREQYEGES